MKGRTGLPEMKITESPVIEYRWILKFFDHLDEEVGRYAEARWYLTMAECIYSSKDIDIDLAQTYNYFEVDFESRIKEA